MLSYTRVRKENRIIRVKRSRINRIVGKSSPVNEDVNEAVGLKNLTIHRLKSASNRVDYRAKINGRLKSSNREFKVPGEKRENEG